MNYGEKISRLRRAKGMTQEELGKVLNVTYQAVSKWERGESLPDFATMSQIAKFFQVPLDYFEDEKEIQQEAAFYDAAADTATFIGMCTDCGKILKEDEVFATSPKIICKSCAEKQRQEALQKQKDHEAAIKREKERAAERQRGVGFDKKLVVSLLLAFVGYIILTVLCCNNQEDRDLLAVLLFIVPLAVFACTAAVFELIADFKDIDDGPEGYKRNLSLIVGAAFALINLVLFLILYLSFDKQPFFLGMLALGTILSFTFISQFMWGSAVKDIFTCGGFTFKLPGFIFSLTPESILWMIVTKIVLGIISILVFILTTIFFALIAIFGSFFTFIPCVISKTVKDKNA